MGGLDWKWVGWCVCVCRGAEGYPAFLVDVAALCGPPHTDTAANESDLVSPSLKIYVSALAEQSTPPLIF